MNVQNVAQRELLDFSQFLKKVHDNDYKPLSPANQSEGGLAKSGQSHIKREPRYDYAGYADAVFGHQSKIDSPGYRIDINGKSGMMDVGGFGNVSNMGTNESLDNESFIKRLSDF
jgi:hypothetical protein